jgi:hypothetical protein
MTAISNHAGEHSASGLLRSQAQDLEARLNAGICRSVLDAPLGPHRHEAGEACAAPVPLKRLEVLSGTGRPFELGNSTNAAVSRHGGSHGIGNA